MRECIERESIKNLVESHGGQMKLKWLPGAVHLEPALPKSLVLFPKPTDHSVYSYHYVKDATRIGSLPDDKDIYELRYKRSNDDPVETDSQTQEPRGRNKFTQREEELMIEYMSKYPGKFGSLSYWTKALEHGLVVERTDNTLRSHYKGMKEGKTVAQEELRKSEMKKRTEEREKERSSAKKAKSMEKKTSPEVPVHLSPQSPPQVQRVLPQSSPQSSHYGLLFSSPRIAQSPALSLRTPQGKISPLKERSTGKSSVHSIPELIKSPAKLGARFENTPDLIITADTRGRKVRDVKELAQKCRQENVQENFQALVARCTRVSGEQLEAEDVLRVLISLQGDIARTVEYFYRG